MAVGFVENSISGYKRTVNIGGLILEFGCYTNGSEAEVLVPTHISRRLGGICVGDATVYGYADRDPANLNGIDEYANILWKNTGDASNKIVSYVTFGY